MILIINILTFITLPLWAPFLFAFLLLTEKRSREDVFQNKNYFIKELFKEIFE